MGWGSPEYYYKLGLSLRPGMIRERNDILRHLVEIQYTRNDMDFQRGTFSCSWAIFWRFSQPHKMKLRFELSFWGR